MPELPDITVYLECLAPRVLGQPIERVRVASPFVVRTAEPPIRAVEGKRVLALRRLGKRIVLALEDELFLVMHLMIAGRLRWRDRGAKVPGKLGLAAFDFPTGTLLFTEPTTRKRAAIHLVGGEAALAAHDPGGIEPLACDEPAFRAVLARENRTLKRALTDPTLVSGIGNAYSDEILHRARLSPVTLTSRLDDETWPRLFDATRSTLIDWTERLRAEVGDGFPEKVTAFRDGMAVHGRFGKPCPDCGAAVQRLVFAENEANYCARCQTGGKLLADRALSRLLKKDWPRSLDELEERRERAALTPSAPSATATATPRAARAQGTRRRRAERRRCRRRVALGPPQEPHDRGGLVELLEAEHDREAAEPAHLGEPAEAEHHQRHAGEAEPERRRRGDQARHHPLARAARRHRARQVGNEAGDAEPEQRASREQAGTDRHRRGHGSSPVGAADRPRHRAEHQRKPCRLARRRHRRRRRATPQRRAARPAPGQRPWAAPAGSHAVVDRAPPESVRS
ncbi:MAG: hypothetical protein IPK07_32085 [Deltaproteobacteria bacterium]|nr:hypothetical protein [Deltaproteobacteria bacterium]